MALTSDTAAILANVKADRCLPGTVESLFFAEIETRLATWIWPASPEPAVQSAAARALGEVVARDLSEDLTCQGPLLSDGSFAELTRVRSASDYHKYLPAADRELFLESIARTESEFSAATADELRAWIEPHLSGYTGELTLAHPRGVAWVTDVVAVGLPLPAYASLIDRLGLSHLFGDRAGIAFRYPRAVAPPLHLPRSLDAVGHPPFAIEEQCDASSGRTKPLSVGLPGLPEAVHRGCQIAAGTFTGVEVVT